MQVFYLLVKYGDTIWRDEEAIHHTTVAAAIAHGDKVAAELGRNNSKEVLVAVLDDRENVLAQLVPPGRAVGKTTAFEQ
jgi:hypothetical protein